MKTIDELLKEFERREEVRACRRPQGAFSQCAQISKLLIAEAEKAGIPARLIRLEGESWQLREEAWCRNRGLNPYTLVWCHHIAQIGGEYVDYTYRQFFPKAAFPVRDTSLECWLEDWERQVEKDATTATTGGE